jgi:hypothetical protein
VHYLVPLPPGVHEGSPELLSFFTYELRIGHDTSLWSTARGRFGPPLVLEGVQHPAPDLACSARRSKMELVAEARYAEPYYRGVAVQPDPPGSEIWISLYAQVPRADGSGLQNVQIAVRCGTPGAKSPGRAEVRWDDAAVQAALSSLGLPESSPLSVLAVELLPQPIARFADPLGADLGEVRILRTSTLVAVNAPPC